MSDLPQPEEEQRAATRKYVDDDPTKNVEDLFRAGQVTTKELRAADNRFLDAQITSLDKLQTFARDADTRLQNFARDAEAKLSKTMFEGETRRIDQLAILRQDFQNTIRDMLAESVRTTSTLVSTQLVQIQATFDTRVSKLEAFQFTQAGRSSVNDPAISDAMSRMSASITDLARGTADTMGKMTAMNAEAMAKLAAQVSGIGSTGEKGENQRVGQVQAASFLQSVLLLAIGAGAIITPIILHFAK